MSGYETHIGKISFVEKIPNKEELLKWLAEQNLHTDSVQIKNYEIKNVDDDFYDSNFMLIFEDGKWRYSEAKFVYHNGNIYKFVEHINTSDEPDIYHTSTNELKTEISFVYNFYNGGTCFSEILEEGLDDLDK